MKPIPRLTILCLGLLPFLLNVVPASGAVFDQYISFDVPGETKTAGSGINDFIEVTGFSFGSGATHGFIRNPNGTFNGPFSAPGDNQGFTRGLGINNAGVVVGDYLNLNGNTFTYHGYILVGNIFTQYDHGGPFSTSLFGINNAGHLVGTFGSNAQPNRPFIDQNGVITDINIPGATSAFGFGINDFDQIVGQFTDGSNVTHGYFRDANGALTQLDVPGSQLTAAIGINNSGTIVGTFEDASGAFHGFYTDPLMFFPFDFPGGFGTEILGINGAGDITGLYFDSLGVEHGFIAIAVPEPASFALAVVGVVGLAGFAWRRKGQK